MNKHGFSRRWFTETHVKHFKSGALRTFLSIMEKEYMVYTLYGKLKKKEKKNS